MIRSVLHYVSSIWTSCDKENLSRVFKLQKRAARVISDANNQAPSVKLFPWDACGTPAVKIRFGCIQNCKASQ